MHSLFGKFTQGVHNSRRMGLKQNTKRSPAKSELLFQLDPEPLEETLTSMAAFRG